MVRSETCWNRSIVCYHNASASLYGAFHVDKYVLAYSMLTRWISWIYCLHSIIACIDAPCAELIVSSVFVMI